MKCRERVFVITNTDNNEKKYLSYYRLTMFLEGRASFKGVEKYYYNSEDIVECPGEMIGGEYTIGFHCDARFTHVGLKELDFDRNAIHQPIQEALDKLE